MGCDASKVAPRAVRAATITTTPSFSKRIYKHNSDGSLNIDLLRELVVGIAAQDAAETSISFHKVSGGITNQLFRTDFADGRDSVLVRIFGAEGMIDRK